MAEVSKAASATKRKPAAKRKPVAKRKPAAKRKPVARKTTPEFAVKAQEAGRNVFLAGLGFYGKAFDQAQEQYKTIQDRMESRRKQADKLYKELVKRGKKVEKNAKVAFKDIELDIDNLTDRKKLDKQLKKVKARFEDLKDTVGLKAAA